MAIVQKFLGAILINALVAIAAFSNGSTISEKGFTVTKVGDGVYAAVGDDGGAAGSNAGFIVGSNGVIVVDSFQGIMPAKDLLTEIRKVTNLPIRYVINTHYHLDHVGGNAVLAEAGATILAHRNVRGWERTENLKFFGATPKPDKRALVEALVLPDMTYTDSVDIHLGDRSIKVCYMLGHTGGDSVVIVPGTKNQPSDIVFAGDIVWQKHLPNLIDASTGPWIETLDKLLAEYPTATFVSGHGGVASVSDVTDFRNYLATLRKTVEKAQSEGKAADALIAQVTTELKEAYGKWGFFDYFIKPNIVQTAAELKGAKRIPVPVKN